MKVWNAEEQGFQDETLCVKCGSTLEKPESKNSDEKISEELQSESEPQREKENEEEIYQKFKRDEKIRSYKAWLSEHPTVEPEETESATSTNETFEDVNKTVDEPRDSIAEKPKTTCVACGIQVDFFSGKNCKYCNELCCFKHLLTNHHDCIKSRYVKYIRKTWLIKYGQNITGGKYTVVCETCGFVSDFPSLIEYAGAVLESHLENNENCKQNKRTFLEELVEEPMPKEKIKSSVSIDPNRTLWVCAHCRPPQKFTNRDDYIAHHYIHN